MALVVASGVRAAGDRASVSCSLDTGCNGKSYHLLLHAAYSAHVACMVVDCQSASERQQQLAALVVASGVRAAEDRPPVECSPDTGCSGKSNQLLLYAVDSAHSSRIKQH